MILKEGRIWQESTRRKRGRTILRAIKLSSFIETITNLEIIHILSYLAQSWLGYVASRGQSSATQRVNNNIQIMIDGRVIATNLTRTDLPNISTF